MVGFYGIVGFGFLMNESFPVLGVPVSVKVCATDYCYSKCGCTKLQHFIPLNTKKEIVKVVACASMCSTFHLLFSVL